MATAGSLVTDFVSQNAVTLIAAVLATVIVVAVSTYYLARGYMLSNSTNTNAQAETTTSTTSQSPAEKPSQEINEQDSIDEDKPTIDPVFYCEHIQGEIKKVKQDVTTRKICEGLSDEEIAKEKLQQKNQLEEIFRLMQEQQDRFGITSMDEMQDQMRLYANI